MLRELQEHAQRAGRDVRAHGTPMFGLDHWAYSDGRSGVAEFGMMPLAFEGNTVAQVLTIEDTKEFDLLSF